MLLKHSFMFLCRLVFLFLLGLCLQVELLGHVVILCLIVWDTAKLFQIQLHHFIFLPAFSEGIDFFASTQTFVSICLFEYSYLSGCEVLSWWFWFAFYFPFWLVMLSIFLCACLHIFFRETSPKIHAHFRIELFFIIEFFMLVHSIFKDWKKLFKF